MSYVKMKRKTRAFHQLEKRASFARFNDLLRRKTTGDTSAWGLPRQRALTSVATAMQNVFRLASG